MDATTIDLICTIIFGPLIFAILLDVFDDANTKNWPKKIIIGLIIVVILCLIAYIISHFVFSEFYAIEQLISS